MVPSRLRELLNRAVCLLILAVCPALAGAQNTGADLLAEVPAIQQLIREEKAQGNAAAAWDLEQGLLRLAARYPDEVQSARILRDVGDRRLDILAQYRAGEYPPEIAFGCYYNNNSQSDEAARRGSQPVASAAVSDAGNGTCSSGTHSRARRALAGEIQSLYVEAARILQRSEEDTGDELPELLMKLLAISYQYSNYGNGRWSLESLLSHQQEISAATLVKAETLALMGDWDLMFVQHFGTKYSESAAALYLEALTLLAEDGDSEELANTIFSTQTPILLPAFTSNPLVSAQQADSTGHVDIEFEIRDDGRSARVKILDSSINAPRSVERELANTIKQGRFRPVAANGRLVDSASVSLRYYLNAEQVGLPP